MQQTSDLYKDLLASKNYWVETRLSIGDIGRLITKKKERITFGGVSILVGASGADAGFGEDILCSMSTDIRVFSSDTPCVGSCVAGEIDIKMCMPSGDIPRQARLVPYVRLTDGVRYSEWLQKGVYFIDTRRVDKSGDSIKWLTIHGYDAMLKAEMDYPSSTLQWPAKDIDVVREIAAAMGVDVDPRTVATMTRGYSIQYPAEYSCRESLGYIAAGYGGCFVMSDLGELRLITLNNIPPETRYLVTSGADHSPITFGGVRILV